MNTPLVAFGDLHLRANPPEMRIDDYIETQERKLRWCFEQIPKNSIVAFPGDIYNSSREPYWIIELFIAILNSRRDLWYLFVPGQHDQRYHQLDLHNTPIKLTQTAIRNSSLLDAEGLLLRGLNFIGRAYGDKIPKPLPESKKTQILVAHKMLVKDEDLYPGQNAILTKTFMRLYPYDLILSGDNHQRFVERTGGRLLVNMGSFMRMKSDQRKHKPAIAIIDIDNELKLNIVEIPCTPAKEVFASKEVSAKKLVRTIGKDFIYGIKEDEKKGVTFIDRLHKKLKKEDSRVQSVIDNCLQQVKGE